MLTLQNLEKVYSDTQVPAAQASYSDIPLNNLHEEKVLLVGWHVMGWSSSQSIGQPVYVDDGHHPVGKYLLKQGLG